MDLNTMELAEKGFFNPMKKIENHYLKTGLIIVLFFITFLIIQTTDSVTNTPIKKKLSDFPEKIGDWTVVNQQDLSEAVEDILGVDDYISSNYVSSNGDIVNLYISYFSALGVTGTYHSPLNCMPGGGLRITNTEIIQLKNNEKIKKITLSQNKQNNDAYYWYYDRGRVVYSEYFSRIYLVLDALFQGRRDGSFIRIISYPKNKSNSDKELIDFIEQVSVLLEDYIPGSEKQGL